VTPNQLAGAIAALPSLEPATRAEAAKRLIEDAKGVLAEVRRTAITEMLTSMTYQQAADRLGVSPAAVNAAVTKQHARDPIAVRGVIEPAVRAWAGGRQGFGEREITALTAAILSGWLEAVGHGGARPGLRKYVARYLRETEGPGSPQPSAAPPERPRGA
jgi:hypothetical protein